MLDRLHESGDAADPERREQDDQYDNLPFARHRNIGDELAQQRVQRELPRSLRTIADGVHMQLLRQQQCAEHMVAGGDNGRLPVWIGEQIP